MSDELKPLSKRHQVVLDKYLMCWNQTEAYKEAYPSVDHASAKASAARLFANVNFLAHLEARLTELQATADEALVRTTEISRGYIGLFFKIVDEWMFNPLPTYEILDEKEVIDEEATPPKKRISYRVRHVALDMDKVMDPQYSHLIREFSDSRRSGLSIKLYSAHEAQRDIMKIGGKLKEHVVLTWRDVVEGARNNAHKPD